MTKIDFITCRLSLGGDGRHVVTRGDWNPVSWPEAQILMYTHGQTALQDIEFLETRDVELFDEWTRLKAAYKANDFEEVYPGQNPSQFPCEMPEHMKDPNYAPPKPAPKQRKTRRKANPKANAEVELGDLAKDIANT